MARALLVLLLLVATGCGPAFRFRPPETLGKDEVEVGVGMGAAARTANGRFGGAELVGWVRGGVDSRVELGGRFFTHSFNTFGAELDVRVQVIRGPVDLTLDLGLLAGGCCGAAAKWNLLGGAVGIDGGFSFGKRLGGAWGPSVYVAPHVQGSWTFPVQQSWPVQLFIPVGVDVPLGKSPLSLRAEFITVGLFQEEGPVRWRVGGGLAFAVKGPAKPKKKAKKADDEDELKAYRRRLGLPPGDDG